MAKEYHIPKKNKITFLTLKKFLLLVIYVNFPTKMVEIPKDLPCVYIFFPLAIVIDIKNISLKEK